jgi:RNA polymerase sigma factor (sigma-70 family)
MEDDDRSDSALLTEYVASGGEKAFAALILRYKDLVYRTCFRILGDVQHAEDATQTVFILLDRKASSLANRARVDRWIHQTARYTAWRFRKHLAVRARIEKEARSMKPQREEAMQSMWEAVRPELDDAVAALSPRLRDAVILHHLVLLRYKGA